MGIRSALRQTAASLPLSASVKLSVLPRRGVEAASHGSEATVTTIVPKLKSSKNKMYIII
jgi:hypothetical protein